MFWCLIFVAFTLLFVSVPVTSTSINITDGEILKEYLCSPKRTIPPHTHLIIHADLELNNLTDVVCLVENTTNIFIMARQDDPSGYQKPVTVSCMDKNSGFNFFNVTDLTINSIYFKDCGKDLIPPAATKYIYINESEQFFEYDIAQTTLLFSHCYNLTLYNALGDCNSYKSNDNRASIIGVNLCGWSNITAVVPDRDMPSRLITLLVYYTDSAIMSSNQECNLHIESNILSGRKHVYIMHDLANNTERMPVLPIRDFALYIAQQDFEVNANIVLHPMLYNVSFPQHNDCIGMNCGLNAIIMFINIA